MIKQYHISWQHALEQEFAQPYFIELEKKIEAARQTEEIFPPEELVFHAFQLTPLEQTKVVLLGQDPYHNKGQAQGLAFSVPFTEKIPPSLRNIQTELFNDLNILPQAHGNLTQWAESGVLLLNTALTVQAHKAGAHSKWGWHPFTQAVLQYLSDHHNHLVFILWGNHAQQFEKCIDGNKHLILKSAHPSPLSAHNGFWNNKHFSTTNAYLTQHHKEPINW